MLNLLNIAETFSEIPNSDNDVMTKDYFRSSSHRGQAGVPNANFTKTKSHGALRAFCSKED